MSTWLVVAIALCAVRAVLARQLVASALWLVATSALLAVLLATMDAPVVAVTELSVGAGLVAVLFVFTIGVAGEQGFRARPSVPTLLALGLVVPSVALLLWLTVPAGTPAVQAPGATGELEAPAALGETLWKARAADVLGQVALIVVGALGVRAILGDGAPTTKTEGDVTPQAVRPLATTKGPAAAADPVARERQEVSV